MPRQGRWRLPPDPQAAFQAIPGKKQAQTGPAGAPAATRAGRVGLGVGDMDVHGSRAGEVKAAGRSLSALLGLGQAHRQGCCQANPPPPFSTLVLAKRASSASRAACCALGSPPYSGAQTSPRVWLGKRVRFGGEKGVRRGRRAVRCHTRCVKLVVGTVVNWRAAMGEKLMLSRYPINSRVSVHITRSIPSGLLGRLEDGTRAIIRNREIGWEGPPPPDGHVGQTRPAVVVGYNPAYDELELSLRLTEQDPWQSVPTRYQRQTEVQGTVIGLIGGAAFVEIEPGVEGFLPVSELPVESDARIEDWLWPGDHVKALITEADPARRRLRLSVRSLLARREVQYRRRLWASCPEGGSSDVALGELLPAEIRKRLLRTEALTTEPSYEDWLEVLIIEDDDAYARGLESLLRQNRCRVTRASDGLAGLAVALAPGQRFDLVIVDWNLPACNGAQVLRRLIETRCPSHLTMVLNPVSPKQGSEIREMLLDSDVDVFSKADAEGCKSGLISIIRDLRSGEFHRAPVRRYTALDLVASPQPCSPSVTGSASTCAEGSQPESLGTALMELQRDTQASTVALLRLDPGRSRLELEACAGLAIPIDKATPDLIHSPLSDVLLKGEEVCALTTHGSLRFKRLLSLARFEGFLGTPVLATDSSRYGLLLLRQEGAFGSRERHLARRAACAIAARLLERRLMGALQPWQAQNLAGQLASAALHEINNKLGGLYFQVEGLQNRVRELIRWPERAGDAAFLSELEETADRIVAAQREVGRLRDRYLGLTAYDDPQPVDLRTLVEDVIGLLRSQAQNGNVVLEVHCAKGLPPVYARPSRLRQLVLNLLLNAMQQMMQLGREGTVRVEIAYHPQAPLPLRLRVIDEGPGVHRELWERIFDLGFSTKKGGAGLGLTISRDIATDLGGQLQVEESHMLWGTAFLLQLPKGV